MVSGRKPRIAITMGDPCGVGPEIIMKVLSTPEVFDTCTPIVIGDPLALTRAADLLKVSVDTRIIEQPVIHPYEDGVINLIKTTSLSEKDIVYGNPGKAACEGVVSWIDTAVCLAMQGEIEGICTCPIHKANLNRHGFPFPGHTEFLRELTRAEDVVMMLAGPKLMVSLVTIHHSLAEVPSLLNAQSIRRTIEITAHSLRRDFGLSRPRLAVAAVNPHAGEAGAFGKEEIELIRPVIEGLRSDWFVLSGPLSPDTVFYRAYQGEFDAVVAMYHDQGLIPIKLVHFHEAVNVTLGLPIVRTSVDHGTAYDLAGKGTAGAGSLKAALSLSAFMINNRRCADPV